MCSRTAPRPGLYALPRQAGDGRRDGLVQGPVYEAVQKLESGGFCAAVPHGTELLPPARRFHLTAAGLRRLADEEDMALDELVRRRPLSAQWRRSLMERLDAVASVYSVASAVSDVSYPRRFRWYRAMPLDVAMTLPDGKTVGVVRQGLTCRAGRRRRTKRRPTSCRSGSGRGGTTARWTSVNPAGPNHGPHGPKPFRCLPQFEKGRAKTLPNLRKIGTTLLRGLNTMKSAWLSKDICNGEGEDGRCEYRMPHQLSVKTALTCNEVWRWCSERRLALFSQHNEGLGLKVVKDICCLGMLVASHPLTRCPWVESTLRDHEDIVSLSCGIYGKRLVMVSQPCATPEEVKTAREELALKAPELKILDAGDRGWYFPPGMRGLF